MSDEPYNGWENWETWNVALWFANEEPLYRRTHSGRPWTAAGAEELAREVYPDGTPDMDPAELARVDWQEIADAWNEE